MKKCRRMGESQVPTRQNTVGAPMSQGRRFYFRGGEWPSLSSNTSLDKKSITGLGMVNRKPVGSRSTKKRKDRNSQLILSFAMEDH